MNIKLDLNATSLSPQYERALTRKKKHALSPSEQHLNFSILECRSRWAQKKSD